MSTTFILCPDSFKGTLSAQEICALQNDAIRQLFPDAAVHMLPMSDGGEGMVSAYHRILGGELISSSVSAPLGGHTDAEYLLLPDHTAVIEMSAAAGLPMVLGRENPMETTTRGVGELILHAVSHGASKILLGLGGSCTNDCGIGMAHALGYRFLDADRLEVEPFAKNLRLIETIIPPAAPLNISLRVACDVDNPLTGENGATMTFGPQKGATPEMLDQLEQGMVHFSHVLSRFCSLDELPALPGTGAAGGMGAAALAFLNANLLPGAELLLETAKFDELLLTADYVITGEGRIDWQSAHGKVIGTVSHHCQAAHVPCIALCGSIGKNTETLYEHGVTAIFSATQGPCTFADIQKSAAKDLTQLTEAALRLIKSVQH